MKTFLPKSKLGTYATHQIFGFWKTVYLSTKFLGFEKFGTTWLYIRRRTKFLDFENLVSNLVFPKHQGFEKLGT